MADSCENLSRQPSSDRKVNLLRSYCDVYDQLSQESQGLSGNAKLAKLDEMAKTLNKIEELLKNRNNPSSSDTSVEIGKDIPFSILQGTMKVRILGFDKGFNVSDGSTPLSGVAIERLSATEYRAKLMFDRREVELQIQYSGNILTVLYQGNRVTQNIDNRQKLIQQPLPGGGRETFTTTNSAIFNIGNLQLQLGNFR